jgi:Fe-S-cluster-containing dehydrogenase component/DMSO reductase anchor subunit
VLSGGTKKLPMLQMVTASCHHCAHPACMDGCPAKAYEKDEITGIVKHLDDQCIGCQYCIMKCPYDAPKFNPRQGIVRKCDMCSSRLAVGEAPACAQACPNTAIRITLVDKDDREQTTLPGLSDPEYTHPTTKYKRRSPLPSGTRPADHHRIAAEPAHLSLVLMLVLTQLSVGAFIFGPGAHAGVQAQSQRLAFLFWSLAAGLAGMSCAVLHLGRPFYAFRALLGIRTSWLSREIAAFGIFATAATAYVGAAWIGASSAVQSALQVMTALSGLLGVFCSTQIYADTRRAFWNFPDTAAKFFLSAAISGCAAAVLISPSEPCCVALAALMLLKLSVEAVIFKHLYARGTAAPQRKSAILLVRDFGAITCARFALGLSGGILLPIALALRMKIAASTAASESSITIAMLALIVLGELLERYLFFRVVVPLKMPGEAAV